MKRTLEFVIDCGQENMDVRTFVRRYLGFSARILTALKYEGEMLKNGEPVHMAHLGHPVAGDDLYGGHRDRIARQALHCARQSFRVPAYSEVPGGIRLETPVEEHARTVAVESPLPEDMRALLDAEI